MSTSRRDDLIRGSSSRSKMESYDGRRDKDNREE
jgi:hypothetical protein